MEEKLVDRHIGSFACIEDRDLMICNGVAYQIGMETTVEYDEAYYRKCAGYDPIISSRVVEGRIDLVARHHTGRVLDIGVGAGQFVAQRPETFGFDINPYAVEQLKRLGLYADDFESFRAFTFWDTIEHIANPQEYLDRVPEGSKVFVSLPIFPDLASIRESRHYRPGEHLYYWTGSGFVHWMSLYGFKVLEINDHESRAGRESILSFAFSR